MSNEMMRFGLVFVFLLFLPLHWLAGEVGEWREWCNEKHAEEGLRRGRGATNSEWRPFVVDWDNPERGGYQP